jgi:hypothetical protein
MRHFLSQWSFVCVHDNDRLRKSVNISQFCSIQQYAHALFATQSVVIQEESDFVQDPSCFFILAALTQHDVWSTK